MRFVVWGLGAVGGVIAGRLARAGHDVVGVARGEQLATVRRQGLSISSPDGTVTVPLDVVDEDGPAPTPDDVVLLCVKGQDTDEVGAVLRSRPSARVVCMQNGVANEERLLRRGIDARAGLVLLPVSFVRPGEVLSHSTPSPGTLDVGGWPGGHDDRDEEVAAALRAAGFRSRATDDIRRFKCRKLVMNLANAVDAACGEEAARGELGRRAREEGERVLAAAGWAMAGDEEWAERRIGLSIHDADGAQRPGGSTWQSLARGRASEVDWLTGEVVLQGRLHGVPTPVNSLLLRTVHRLAAEGAEPGSVRAEDLLAQP